MACVPLQTQDQFFDLRVRLSSQGIQKLHDLVVLDQNYGLLMNKKQLPLPANLVQPYETLLAQLKGKAPTNLKDYDQIMCGTQSHEYKVKQGYAKLLNCSDS